MIFTINRISVWLRALAASCLLAACGGGVETGGTGATGAFVEGPVTGFGSVIVAGIRFDDSTADVLDADDRPFDRSNLRLGMVVEVDSDRPVDDGSGGRNATATRVRLASGLLGPVQAVGLTETRIRVLGQIVRLTPATVLDGLPGGVASLQVNDVVEVHGFLSPDGLLSDLVATRIERRAAAPAAFRVRGVARNVDPVARSLRIGSDSFDLSAIGLPSNLVDGSSIVRLLVSTVRQPGGHWPVQAVVVETRQLADRDAAEVEGLITAFNDTTSFAVSGVAVQTNGGTRFPDGTVGLGVGARVEVEGRILGGVLTATRVELRGDDKVFNEGIDLRGRMSALNTSARSFVVRGTTVIYGSAPPLRYDNGSEVDLANDRCVRVRATLDIDRVRANATRIEFVDNCIP
jgi:Domain of unknown function (DUF5666)